MNEAVEKVAVPDFLMVLVHLPIGHEAAEQLGVAGPALLVRAIPLFEVGLDF